MKAEDERKIPTAVKQEHQKRKIQGMNLHTCMTLHKTKLAELEQMVDQVEQAGDPDKIRELHLNIESEKKYGEELLHRQSVVSKQYAAACDSYNGALARTHECYGCSYLHVDRSDPVKYCMYGYDGQDKKPMPPVSEVKKCPNPSGQMLDRGRPIIGREQKELPSCGEG